MWEIISAGISLLSWLPSKFQLEEVHCMLALCISLNWLLLSNQDKILTPVLAHNLPRRHGLWSAQPSTTCVFTVVFKARTRTSLTLSKWGHFYKARTKFVSLLCDKLQCTLPTGGIEEYKPYPRFVLHVLAIHICPHFKCVDAKIVLALIYLCTLFHTPFILVSSLRMPGHVGCACVCTCIYQALPCTYRGVKCSIKTITPN